MPKRIQRKRTAGWRMPRNTVYVGRPTEWGNPFKVGQYYAPGESFAAHYGHLMDEGRVTDANVIPLFEDYCRRMMSHGGDWLSFLRGKDLACWCRVDSPCHADVLLRLANA